MQDETIPSSDNPTLKFTFYFIRNLTSLVSELQMWTLWWNCPISHSRPWLIIIILDNSNTWLFQSKFVCSKYCFDLLQDFSTRSLKVSEESPMQRQVMEVEDEEENEDGEVVLQLYQMRRTWETRYKNFVSYLMVRFSTPLIGQGHSSYRTGPLLL